MTVPTPDVTGDTVPGITYSLTIGDASDLEHLLAQVDQALTLAYATDVAIPLIPTPLRTQATVVALRKLLRANAVRVRVPVTVAAQEPSPYTETDFVKEGQFYTVRQENGTLRKADRMAGWTWQQSDDGDMIMTPQEFREIGIPREYATEDTLHRSRLRLYNNQGKIAMERFGLR